MNDLEQFLASVFDAAEGFVKQGATSVVSQFSLVSNEAGGVVSYSQGSMNFAGPSSIPIPGRPPILIDIQTFSAGDTSNPSSSPPLFFSNRLLNIDPPPPGPIGLNAPRQPFDANATDRVIVTVSRNLGSAAGANPLTVSIRFPNQGDEFVSFTPTVQSGVLFGSGAASNPGSPVVSYLVWVGAPANETIR